jgi:alkanesulfonate monooxygenase SsuD/methylene tetrahydromethanopterin reductase-like flavin-dependent oxidoreductase (luciferase family)
MVGLAGELADGVFLTWCPPDEAAERVDLARAGARRAGRDPGAVLAVASFFAYAGPDEDAARERLRRYVLQYAMVSTHRDSFARSMPNLPAVERHWRAGDRHRALELVGDDVVDRLCAVGAAATARRATELHDAGVELPIMLAIGARVGDAQGPMATIKRVAVALGPEAPTTQERPANP